MVKVWIESLRRDEEVEENPLLRQLLDSWAPMLEQSSKNRPSAGDLSATLPPGKCCLPATANVLNSQSAVNETQTVSLVGNRPITQHNPPHSSLLDDQKPTAKTLASQAGPVSNTDSQPSRYKMPDRSRTLKLHGKAMTNRTSWSRCFALFSIFITFMSIAATNALILSTLEKKSQKGIFFGAKYPLLRMFPYFYLWSFLTYV